MTEPARARRSGEELELIDNLGTTLARYVWLHNGMALTEGIWLAIKNPACCNARPPAPGALWNGGRGDWRAVMIDLLTHIPVSLKAHDSARDACMLRGQSVDGMYHQVMLAPLLDVGELALLLDVPADRLRSELADYALITIGTP